MSSLTARMQCGAGNHIGLTTSLVAGRGARLGVTNEHANDLKARKARSRNGPSGITPHALRRSKNSIRWLVRRAAKRNGTVEA